MQASIGPYMQQYTNPRELRAKFSELFAQAAFLERRIAEYKRPRGPAGRAQQLHEQHIVLPCSRRFFFRTNFLIYLLLLTYVLKQSPSTAFESKLTEDLRGVTPRNCLKCSIAMQRFILIRQLTVLGDFKQLGLVPSTVGFLAKKG